MVSYPFLQFMDPVPDVLILVVMEDGLVLDAETRNVLELFVLILVVMEDGLVHKISPWHH